MPKRHKVPPEPGMVRRGDYETSIDAACSVDTTKIRSGVLALYREFRELGDADLYPLYVERYGPAVDVSVRKRRGELVAAGYLEITEKRCTFPTGRKGMVWRYIEPASKPEPEEKPAPDPVLVDGRLF